MKSTRFGEKLKELRIAEGKTLQQVANVLGYKSHGYISEVENGRKAPTTDFVIEIARFFNVSTDELLLDEMELKIKKKKS